MSPPSGHHNQERTVRVKPCLNPDEDRNRFSVIGADLTDLVIDPTTPVDVLEPEEPFDPYSDARKLMYLLNRCMLWVLESKRPDLGAWQVAFALGLDVCSEANMTEVAKEMGVTRQAISKGMQIFRRANDLPDTPYGKPIEAVTAYAKARERSLSNDQVDR